MPLTFPRAMPCGVQTSEFEPQRYMATNQLYGGTTQVREVAETRWRGSFTYAPRRRPEHQALQAWLDSLRGGLRAFLAHDHMKPFPVRYPGGVTGLARAGGGAFDGTGGVSGRSAAGFSMTTLPAGFDLKAGDMVGLVEAGRYGLFRLAEDALASASGIAALVVEPRFNTSLFTGAARANLVRPPCTMILDPASVSAPRSAGAPGVVTFAGLQTIS